MNVFNFVIESTVDDSDDDITYTPANSFDSLFCVSNEMGSIENIAGSTVEDLPTTNLYPKTTIDNNCKSSGWGKKKKISHATLLTPDNQDVAINKKVPRHDLFISPSSAAENDTDNQCMLYYYY